MIVIDGEAPQRNTGNSGVGEGTADAAAAAPATAVRVRMHADGASGVSCSDVVHGIRQHALADRATVCVADKCKRASLPADGDGSCIICMEPVLTSGKHRAAALR